MDNTFSSVPWNTPETWQAANTSLSTAIRHHWLAMADLTGDAHTIRQYYEILFPLMDNICCHTCPGCRDICCRRAWVWIDFKDLLFLHLAAIPTPDRQLLQQQGDRCYFAGPEGCRLKRIQRPFVCTWYLCPDQTRLLGNQAGAKQRVMRALWQIKTGRNQMEAAFIRVVSRTP